SPNPRRNLVFCFALRRKRGNTLRWKSLGFACRLTRRFGSKQLPKLPQRREVFCNQLFVFNPITEFIFQKCDQTDQTERVNLKRLLRISYLGEIKPHVFFIRLYFLWVF